VIEIKRDIDVRVRAVVDRKVAVAGRTDRDVVDLGREERRHLGELALDPRRGAGHRAGGVEQDRDVRALQLRGGLDVVRAGRRCSLERNHEHELIARGRIVGVVGRRGLHRRLDLVAPAVAVGVGGHAAIGAALDRGTHGMPLPPPGPSSPPPPPPPARLHPAREAASTATIDRVMGTRVAQVARRPQHVVSAT
jgi:hypothetical protein